MSKYKRRILAFLVWFIAWFFESLIFINYSETNNKQIATVEHIPATISPEIFHIEPDKICTQTIKKIVLRQWINITLIQKWYELSNGDMDFILTVEAESRWDIKAIWDQCHSHGLCQWNKRWHSDIINNPLFNTEDYQLKTCFAFYNDYIRHWVIQKRLFWYNVRLKNKWLFEIKEVLITNCK